MTTDSVATRNTISAMKTLIKKLGTNDKEAETFLKLLELGAQPVSVIAKQMDTPRSSMYLILDVLRKLGLVEEFTRGEIKFVKCISVKNLFDILGAQGREIEQTLSMLTDKLPELEAIENRLSVTPTIKFYEGKKSVMKMYEDVLKEEEFYAFFNPKLVKKAMPEYHFAVGENVRKNNGKAKEILVACEEATEYKKLFDSRNHRIKIFQKNVSFESDTIICEDKIYMISYGENQISGTEIFSRSLAKTQKAIFEQLWRGLV